MTLSGKLIVSSIVLWLATAVGAGIWIVAQSDDGRAEAERAHALVTIGKNWRNVVEDLPSLPRTLLTCQELTGDLAAPCKTAWVRSSGKMLGSMSGFSFGVTFVDGRVMSTTRPEYDD
jgi:hypothetical protein